MNKSPRNPAKHLSTEDIADAARHKLLNYKMKTTIQPGASPPPISKLTSGTASPRSHRHSRGPSLSSPATNVQRHSPPLAPSTPTSRPPSSQTSSRPQSHHRRNSSVSTRRESREIMGASSLPSSPRPSNEPAAGRDDALRTLEGRRPLSFVKGFEQVVVPDWKTPTVEAKFDWPAPSKAPSGSAALGSASLAGKRDSFGKSLIATSSLKDQLQTLLEEEEEEEDEGSTHKKVPVAPRALVSAKNSPQRQRPTNLRLQPAVSIISKRVIAEQVHAPRLRPLSLTASLPSPALTPSPRLSSGEEPTSRPPFAPFTTLPVNFAAPATPSPPVLRTLSLASATLNPSPVTPSVSPSGQAGIASPRSAVMSSSGSADSTKQMRRMSTLSYRSSQSSSADRCASPAFSLSSSTALEPTGLKSVSPAPPNQDRALHLQITYLQQENASLLARIARLQKSLSRKENRDDIAEQLRARVTELEQQVSSLKGRVDIERKEALSAQEVARRLGERLWESERARDATVSQASYSNPTSPSLPHSKGTSASSPRSLFSGRPTSGASSLWGSVGNQSMGSMTDVEDHFGAPTPAGDLGVLPEEDESECIEGDRHEEDEDDTQEVDSTHQVGIEVTLLPETASPGCASSPPSTRSRDSMSAYSLSSASTSEMEAQSLAVLEGMASQGDEYLAGEGAEGWAGPLHDMEDQPGERVESDESFSSLPNPYDAPNIPRTTLQPSTLARFTGAPTPATPTTPTPRTPTVASLQTYSQTPKPSLSLKHAKTASQAAMMSWKFPTGAAKASKPTNEEEKDRFFATLDEDVPRKSSMGIMGKPMGRNKSQPKKSVMRPYLGDDDFEDVLLTGSSSVSSVPHPIPTAVESLRAKETASVPRVTRPRVPSPITAPVPTWSLRAPSPPRATSDSVTRVTLQSRQPPGPSSPASAGTGFSLTKLTSVFSSWVAPPSPAPSVPRITISTPPAPPSRPPPYYGPAEYSPPHVACYTSGNRAVGRDAQPRPLPSPLEKLDFRGGGCRYCEGNVIEL
ncbi:hypothetical protein DACRYDRAFT_24745 [Dacryopinax primogenitus]|uniref:Uncharacterized protein n=1 Tax=Dacryopinax primogenitus (strain DJM 731) TaxID=1858805 RepID=M5FWH1_DACPD|nr:uncharacterized protein DACRYDRAFT_24745 [Dacryopinax primogenitus]EJT97751.1 hypothetical protein DACRYDRAFT_24745 [Dacryopinax primogenitus]